METVYQNPNKKYTCPNCKIQQSLSNIYSNVKNCCVCNHCGECFKYKKNKKTDGFITRRNKKLLKKHG